MPERKGLSPSRRNFVSSAILVSASVPLAGCPNSKKQTPTGDSHEIVDELNYSEAELEKIVRAFVAYTNETDEETGLGGILSDGSSTNHRQRLGTIGSVHLAKFDRSEWGNLRDSLNEILNEVNPDQNKSQIRDRIARLIREDFTSRQTQPLKGWWLTSTELYLTTITYLIE